MTYVLESISQKDQEKIVGEVDNKSIIRDLVYVRKTGEFTKKWAIDREKNHYLFLAPDIVRTDRMGCKYYMFYRQRLFVLHINDVFGQKIYIEGKDDLKAEFLSKFEEDIKQAFAIYGRNGNGPLNKSGMPVSQVVPEFDWEMK